MHSAARYEAVIRVNSQSGKGGIAHLLQLHHGLYLPPDMGPDFSRAVQRATDDSGQEATPTDLWELFRSTYLAPGEEGPLTLDSWSTSEPAPGEHRVRCDLGGSGTADGRGRHEGAGNGPLAAFGPGEAGGPLRAADGGCSSGARRPTLASDPAHLSVVWGPAIRPPGHHTTVTTDVPGAAGVSGATAGGVTFRDPHFAGATAHAPRSPIRRTPTTPPLRPQLGASGRVTPERCHRGRWHHRGPWGR
ncbi:hypothetical protein [Streptomyces platensis]